MYPFILQSRVITGLMILILLDHQCLNISYLQYQTYHDDSNSINCQIPHHGSNFNPNGPPLGQKMLLSRQGQGSVVALVIQFLKWTHFFLNFSQLLRYDTTNTSRPSDPVELEIFTGKLFRPFSTGEQQKNFNMMIKCLRFDISCI